MVITSLKRRLDGFIRRAAPLDNRNLSWYLENALQKSSVEQNMFSSIWTSLCMVTRHNHFKALEVLFYCQNDFLMSNSRYLTYHRWAHKDQVLKAYPQFLEFMKLKKTYDPQERFQSEWYRHYKKMFSEELK